MIQPAIDFPDFVRGSLLLGVDSGGNPIGVLVDTDGNINAILRGQGASGLQTIAVDEDGRIEVFILDAQSQWGDVLRVGNAELAARLGSVKAWDWRGNVIYCNDFSKGTGNVLRYYNGAGSGISIDPLYWVNGGYSLKLVAGSDGDRDAYVDVYIDHPPAGKIGIEVHVSGVSNFEYWYVRVQYADGITPYLAGLKVVPDGAPDVHYLNSVGTWVKIGDAYVVAAHEGFYHYKFVVDTETHYYERAVWGHTQYDLSAQLSQQSGSVYPDTLVVRFYLKGDSGDNDEVYLDYLLVTVDEPENA